VSAKGYFESSSQQDQGRRQKNFQGEGAAGKARPKNSTIKPPSTLSVTCMKIQGVTALLPPAADAHEQEVPAKKNFRKQDFFSSLLSFGPDPRKPFPLRNECRT